MKKRELIDKLNKIKESPFGRFMFDSIKLRHKLPKNKEQIFRWYDRRWQGPRVYPVSDLKYSKKKIRSVLVESFIIAEDKKMVEVKAYIKLLILCLKDFLPDNDVPTDERKNLILWIKIHEKEIKQILKLINKFAPENKENQESEIGSLTPWQKYVATIIFILAFLSIILFIIEAIIGQDLFELIKRFFQ